MQTLYPAKINSPITTLSSGATAGDTTLHLTDASVLPDPPNIAVIGDSSSAETILYTGKNSNDITGCTRGFQGTAAEWGASTYVSRMFTAYDYEALKSNLEDTTILNSQTAGESLTQYNLVYLKSDGKWWKASALAPSTCSGQLGIALSNISAESTGTIQLLGKITNGSWSWTAGNSLYVSDTSGAISSIAGTYNRIVGFAISSTVMYFFPRPSVSSEVLNMNIVLQLPVTQNATLGITGSSATWTTEVEVPSNFSTTITIT